MGSGNGKIAGTQAHLEAGLEAMLGAGDPRPGVGVRAESGV